MSKFYGNVGFSIHEETAPDVYSETLTKRPYRGDVIRRRRRVQASDHQNDEFSIDNEISIVADDFACTNLPFIRFVEWMGAAWKVTSVDVQFPRLILTIGGVYNGNTDSVS